MRTQGKYMNVAPLHDVICRSPNAFEPGDPSFDAILASTSFRHKYVLDLQAGRTLRHVPEAWIKLARTIPPSFDPVHAIGVVHLALLVEDNTLLPTAPLMCRNLGERISPLAVLSTMAALGTASPRNTSSRASRQRVSSQYRVTSTCDRLPPRRPRLPQGSRRVRMLKAMLRELMSSSLKLVNADPATLSLSVLGAPRGRVTIWWRNTMRGCVAGLGTASPAF